MHFLSDVMPRLDVFLDDTKDARGNYQFPLELRVDGWNFAQQQFETHTLREASATLMFEADSRTAVLPTDFAEAGMVYESGSAPATYTQRRFSPGALRSGTASDNHAYWCWAGKMVFEMAMTGKTVYMDYFAHWPKVARLGESEVLVPDWSVAPLTFLAAAYCLQPVAIRAAMSRNANIRIDSGQPEDNSRRVQARELWWWYTEMMSKHPAQVRQFGYG